MDIPVIDDRIRHIGPAGLRGLNAQKLRELKEILVIGLDSEPLAVVIPYAMYLELQAAMWPSSLVPAIPPVMPASGPSALTSCPTLREYLPAAEPVTSLTTAEDGTASTLPMCSHCGRPSPLPLCRLCFLAGHRAQGCTLCPQT